MSLLASLWLAAPPAKAPPPTLHPGVLVGEVTALASAAAPGILGVAVRDLATGEAWSWNGSRPFPLQSVFKAFLGAAVLARIDAGLDSLEATITLTEKDLSPPYSPVADAFPGVTTYRVRELLVRATGGSDNMAADVLMARVGGPAAVTRFLGDKGGAGVRIDRYEREFQTEMYGMGAFRPAWKGEAAFSTARAAVPEATRRAATARYLADPRDSATPLGAVEFLRRLQNCELLSPGSTALLLEIMTATTTGAARLKAGLPPGGVLAHKTGTSGTDLGLSPATNDIGLVTLADGRRFAVAIFLAASTQDQSARERTIADVMRAVAKTTG